MVFTVRGVVDAVDHSTLDVDEDLSSITNASAFIAAGMPSLGHAG
jgi:hypothetical protein